MERDFKGVWIPKEIWMSKDLTLQEKVFLIEIDSLDNEKGCFASNAYFADFFNVSTSRCTQVIKSLQDKGFIKTELQRNGNAITKRIIKIDMGGKFSKLGGKFSKLGYLENSEYNNTDINNTINNNSPSIDYESLFNQFYSLYPKKTNKQEARELLTKLLKKSKNIPADFSEIMDGVKRYNAKLKFEKTEKQYFVNPAKFLRRKRWLDDFEIDNKPKDVLNYKEL